MTTQEKLIYENEQLKRDIHKAINDLSIIYAFLRPKHPKAWREFLKFEEKKAKEKGEI